MVFGHGLNMAREMDWESDSAKEYRNRAKELRATAERMTDKGSRETLISIAAVYERCAAMVERNVKNDSDGLPQNSS